MTQQPPFCPFSFSENSTIEENTTKNSSRDDDNTMLPPLPRHILSTLFSSLARDSTRWTLTRTLKSDNPMDINGVLRGTATFRPLRGRKGDTLENNGHGNGNNKKCTGVETRDVSEEEDNLEMVYHEEGEMPSSIGLGMGMVSGLRWTKKYIWRLDPEGRGMSVWFVKVGQGQGQQRQQQEEEADYLFHEFVFDVGSSDGDGDGSRNTDTLPSPPSLSLSPGTSLDAEHTHGNEDNNVSPPTPPLPSSLPPSSSYGDKDTNTTILTARGNHLCINDMYRTAYAFRVRPTGEVVSWSSRHVVKGPKKNQDIVNLHEREG